MANRTADPNRPADPPSFYALSQASVSVITVAGIVAIFTFALQASSGAAYFSSVAVGLAIAGSSLLVGALVGFLFGIPRKRQRGDIQNATETEKSSGMEGANASSYQANTNLEQISDWLTKILVGVGLTQIGSLREGLGAVGQEAAKGLGDFEASKSFAVAMIVYFAVAGFLLGYIWTSLYLGRALTEAEETYALKKKLTRLEEQAQADAVALQVTGLQLSGNESEQVAQEKLNSVLVAASAEARAQIFYRAEVLRQRNWREDYTKPTMERTIPIFRALIESDQNQQFHRNHGSLGFALKDQRNLDWQAAKLALSAAISIRRNVGEDDWYTYEANRAICSIMLDEGFKNGASSSDASKEDILADLRVAFADEWVRNWAKEERSISKWILLNGLTIQSIRKAGAAMAPN